LSANVVSSVKTP